MVGCGCRMFNSDFLCAACNKHWEEHETFFETESERRAKKLPYGILIFFKFIFGFFLFWAFLKVRNIFHLMRCLNYGILC